MKICQQTIGKKMVVDNVSINKVQINVEKCKRWWKMTEVWIGFRKTPSSKPEVLSLLDQHIHTKVRKAFCLHKYVSPNYLVKFCSYFRHLLQLIYYNILLFHYITVKIHIFYTFTLIFIWLCFLILRLEIIIFFEMKNLVFFSTAIKNSDYQPKHCIFYYKICVVK